jgi:hypothetical protein
MTDRQNTSSFTISIQRNYFYYGISLDSLNVPVVAGGKIICCQIIPVLPAQVAISLV